MDRFEDVRDRIKDANDLLAVVESYLPLRRSGRGAVGLCPFHREKTPSFTVYPDTQHFKCYGCGKSGDIFDFVAEREGLSFWEAFELLGQRVGISTDGLRRSRDGRSGPRTDPYPALASVKGFFQAVLQSEQGRAARDYLAARGLSDGVEAFGLGFHPTEAGALAHFARSRKLPLPVLGQAGLLRDGHREPFRGRLMFPIEDARGRVVAFGGRALGDGRPKYLNSPESPFFLKRQVLYGLRQVKDSGERRVVVVEGYTDVIACHLAGFRGAVATLGTALTPDHGRQLMRYATEGVTLLFDGDRAGRAAAERAYASLVETELTVEVALLPEGSDPADLVVSLPGREAAEVEAGRQSFAAVVDGAEDALAMWFRLKRARADLTRESEVARVVQECGRVLAAVSDPTRRAVLLSRMAQHLGLDEATMKRSLGRRRRERAEPEPDAAPAPRREPLSPLAKADLDLLACVVARPELAPEAAGEPCELETVARLLAVAAEAVEADCRGANELVKRLFSACSGDSAAAELLAQSVDLAARIGEPETAFAALRGHRRVHRSRQEAQRIRFQLQEARAKGDQALVDRLTSAYLDHLRGQEAS